MNEEELNRKARKLRIAAAASVALSIAAGIACVITSKIGLIPPTSVLELMVVSAAIPFSIGLAWSLRLPGEVWRKALEPFGGEKDFTQFVAIVALAVIALILAIQFHINIKTKTAVESLSARVGQLETNALLRTDFASPAGDPPGITLTEAASVLSNAYDRIRGMDDVDKAIPKISAGGAEADLETRVRWMEWQAAKAGLMRALEKGYLTREAFETSVRDLGPMPKPKVFGTVNEVYRTEKDEKPSPPYYGPF